MCHTFAGCKTTLDGHLTPLAGQGAAAGVRHEVCCSSLVCRHRVRHRYVYHGMGSILLKLGLHYSVNVLATASDPASSPLLAPDPARVALQVLRFTAFIWQRHLTCWCAINVYECLHCLGECHTCCCPPENTCTCLADLPCCSSWFPSHGCTCMGQYHSQVPVLDP